LFLESYEQILEAKKESEILLLRMPNSYLKLALIKIGKESEAIKCFKKYREILLDKLESKLDSQLEQKSFLDFDIDFQLEYTIPADIFTEITTISLKEKQYKIIGMIIYSFY